MTTLEAPAVPARVFEQLAAAGAEIGAAFERLGREVGRVLDAWQANIVRRLWPELAAEVARQRRARAKYLRRVARPPVTRTTSPAFRAGTRRTKRLAAGGRTH